MARATKKTSTSKRKAAPAKQQRASAARGRQAARAQAPSEPLLDERSRRDIAGVICAVAALALFIVAAMPEAGIVTKWLSAALHIGFGIGAYILPVVLALVSASLFASRIGERLSTRVAVGLLLLFFAVLVMLALFSPNVESGNLNALFLEQNLRSQGGYIGALVAWVLLTLFGQVVSAIIMGGVVVIALIVIGFSVNGLMEKIRSKRSEIASARANDEADLLAMPAAPYNAKQTTKRRRPVKATRMGAALDPAAAQTGVTQQIPFDDPGATQVLDPSAAQAEPARGRRAAATASAPVPARTQSLTRKLGSKRAQELSHQKAANASKRKAVPQGAVPHPSEGFVLPDRSILKHSDHAENDKETEETLRETAALLQDTLSDFGVDAKVVGWAAGPTVTLFKVSLPSGVRVSRVTNLTDDIALAMASQGVRIFSPIPGTNYVGIEVPNVHRRTVLLGDVLPAAGKGPLEVAIGEDVEGHPIVSDLARMPHLLIGGTTGSGKSVAINGMIMSILMRATPAEVRFIMIDPKRVEFTPYNGIPHLYVPVVTECKEAASALSWAVAEMERRLKVFAKVGARNIGQYNAKAQKGMMIGDEEAAELPYIVIVIDELADLMMNVGKEVEMSISRLAQLARAAGIHMIVATQRPSTNVVTGLIKANITNRIALSVASGIDSRVILDTTGAENLIGNGDMLVSKPEYPRPQRFQGCYVSDDEINAVVAHLKEQGEPEYHQEILKTNLISLGDTEPDGSDGRAGGGDDPLLWEAAEIVVNSGLGSTSNIQRRLKVGYSRAGRIMDMLEEKGVVGPPNGSKPREVLVNDTVELETIRAFAEHDEE